MPTRPFPDPADPTLVVATSGDAARLGLALPGGPNAGAASYAAFPDNKLNLGTPFGAPSRNRAFPAKHG